MRRKPIATFLLSVLSLTPWVSALSTLSTAGLAMKAAVAQEQQNHVSANENAAPAGDADCENCKVSVKALDLSPHAPAPSQANLVAFGGFGGALSPIGSADTTYWRNEMETKMREQGIDPVAAAYAPENSFPGFVSRLKDFKLRRLQNINFSFGRAMQEWNKHDYPVAAQMLQAHIDAYPDSPWRGEARLHIGCNFKYNGRFTEAYNQYQLILNNSSDQVGSQSREINLKAHLRLADLYLAAGALNKSQTELTNLLKTDTDWRRRTWARHWLRNINQYEKSNRFLLACGPRALATVLVSLGKTRDASEVDLAKPTNPNGFSEAELVSLARQHGLALRGFRSAVAQLADMPMPAIIHCDLMGHGAKSATTSSEGQAGSGSLGGFSSGFGAGFKVFGITTPPLVHDSAPKPVAPVTDSGHFLVVKDVDKKTRIVHLYDPQIRRHYYLTYTQLALEWTGTGLVRDTVKVAAKIRTTKIAKANGHTSQRSSQRSSQRFALLSLDEMRHIFGGCCGTPSPETSIGQPKGAGVKPQGCKFGSPMWAVDPISLNLFVTDVPLWYETAVGPDVQIGISYNSQDGTNQNSIFGSKWVFSYGSYLVEDTTVRGGTITVMLPDGREDNYIPNDNGTYTNPIGNYNTLKKTGPSSYTLTFPTGDQYIYAIPAGTTSLQSFLVESRDRWGNSLHFGYNSNVQLTTITDALGKVSTLTYNTQGKVTKVTEPARTGMAARSALFSYNSAGDLTGVTDMGGKVFHYSYDKEKNITQIDTPAGTYSFYHEEADGIAGASAYPPPGAPMWENARLTITDPMGTKEQYNYCGDTGQSWYIDKTHFTEYSSATANNYSNASRVTYTIASMLDGTGRITGVTYPDGGTENYVIDPSSGLVTSITDSYNNTTLVAYNSRGQVTRVTDRKGHVTQINYAPNGLDVTSVVNPSRQTVLSATYNNTHQPVTVTDGLGNTNTYSYTSWGAPASVVTPGGATLLDNYDSNHRLASVTLGGAVQASLLYDDAGRVKSSTDASGLTQTFSFDNLNHLTRIAYPDATTVNYTYSTCCGLIDSVRDRAGRLTQYDYDPMKDLLSVQDSSGRSVQMDYDKSGNMLRLRDGNGNNTFFSYDSQNRVIRKTYSDGSYEAYAYNLNGDLVSRRAPSGLVTTNSYDANDNLVAINYPNSPPTRFSYDSEDRPITMTDGIGLTRFGFDVMGRLVSEDGPWSNDAVTYSYNADGQRSGMQINGTNAVSYAFDALQRLSSITAPMGKFTYSYSGGSNLLTGLVRPNGTKTSYLYDNLQRLTQVSNLTAANANISNYAYAYNTSDVRTAMQRQVGSGTAQTLSYGYDGIDQLTSELSNEKPSPLVNTQYSLDDSGNRTKVTNTAGQITYTSNGLNQYTQYVNTVGTTKTTSTLAYDTDGNLSTQTTGSTKNTLSFDAGDRLTTYISSSGGVKKTEVVFVFDGLGRKRIRREFSWDTASSSWKLSNEVHYIFDGMNVVQERNGANAVQVTYTRGLEMGGGIGGLLTRTVGTANYYYHYDGSGNVTQLTDANQSTVAAYTYDSFGSTTSVTGNQSSQPYRFSSKEYIQSCGLYDYGFRFYSPSMGRWINRDPIQEAGGLNLYGFVGNSPINMVDSDGNKSVSILEIGGSVIIGGGISSVFSDHFIHGFIAGSIGTAAGIVVGGVAGALTGGNPIVAAVVAGAVSGGVTEFINQKLDCKEVNVGKIAEGAAFGAMGGGMGYGLGSTLTGDAVAGIFTSYTQQITDAIWDNWSHISGPTPQTFAPPAGFPSYNYGWDSLSNFR